jgi:hypothetical protein
VGVGTTLPSARRALDRAAAGFILVLLGVGSLLLWVGIPYGLLWFFGRVTDSWNGHFLMSVLLIPIAMALFAPALFWLNGLYLRVTGGSGRRTLRTITTGVCVGRWRSSFTPA